MITIQNMETCSDVEYGEEYVTERYIDPDGKKQKRYFTKSAWAKRQARMLMKKKTSPEGKAYVWKLGYNHCVGQFAPETYPTLSGSSLNRKKKPSKKQEDPPEPGTTIHKFSARSRGKVKDKATAFFRATPHNRTFLTLTFIQDLTDYEGVQILNKFLTVLRSEKAGLQYLWVAERQQLNNGRIHFHLLLNRRLPIKRYNALWVLQQYNSGLVGHKENGDIIEKEEVEKRYQYDITSKFRKKDPDSMMAVLNPFDIEPAYNINGLSYYLTKYITKQKKDMEFTCLTWHCSRRISKLFTKEVVSPSTFAYLMSLNNYKIDLKTGECWAPHKLQTTFFTMVYVNNKGAPLSRLKQLEKVNKWVLNNFDPGQLRMIDDFLYRKIIWKS
jgi:hypothetical protein